MLSDVIFTIRGLQLVWVLRLAYIPHENRKVKVFTQKRKIIKYTIFFSSFGNGVDGYSGLSNETGQQPTDVTHPKSGLDRLDEITLDST